MPEGVGIKPREFGQAGLVERLVGAMGGDCAAPRLGEALALGAHGRELVLAPAEEVVAEQRQVQQPLAGIVDQIQGQIGGIAQQAAGASVLKRA
ncbi:hypothetical protein [Salinicola tamaricis]|uniref:hypothetical protein n=1 Tax=Salinicola tamaricis TaxID=1771309 RepID=UPI003BF4A53C